MVKVDVQAERPNGKNKIESMSCTLGIIVFESTISLTFRCLPETY